MGVNLKLPIVFADNTFTWRSPNFAKIQYSTYNWTVVVQTHFF